MKTHDYKPLYTYKDYKLWEGDWELINGYPHAMSPSPFRKHQLLNTEFTFELKSILNRNHTDCKKCRVYQDLDWIVSDNTIVRPDVMIVCKEFNDNFLSFPPILIVEILSVSTSMKDFNNKCRLYESQKVNYYIIISPETKECNLFELQNDVYVQNDKLKDFFLHENCKISFDIPAYVGQLNLD